MSQKKEKIETKKAPAEAVNKKESNSKFYASIVFVIALLLFFLVIIEGTSGWSAIHNFLRGLFGLPVFAMPFLLGYTSIKIAQSKSDEMIMRRLLASLGITLLLCGFIQICFMADIPEELDFWVKVKLLYKNGIELRGGGFMSGLVALTLTGILGNVGAFIVVLLLLLVFFMLLTNTGPIEFFILLAKPFVFIFKSIKSIKNAEDEIRELEPVTKKEKKNKEDKPKEKKRIFDFFSETEEETEQAQNMPIEEEIEELPKSKPIPAIKKSEHKQDNKKKIDEETEELIRKAVENNANKKNKISVEEVVNIQREISANNSGEIAEYQKPPLGFLKHGVDNSDDQQTTIEMKQKSELLVDTLKSFGVETRIVGIYRGPTVTRYEVQPAAGVKVSRITGLADDIALNLAAAGVRMEAPIPGKAAVGIEIPNSNKDIVSLREILETEEFQNSKSKLSFAVGKNIAGEIVLGDVAKMPHVIIAGSTGSGKSVCTNSIIMSILYHASPDEVRLILVDPKIVEFKVYDGIPHLLIPVVTDPRKAAGALNWAVGEMLRRYQLFADANVRDLMGYNEMIAENNANGGNIKPLPQIVIAIDELADLMMAASKEVEDAICRLAQMARAAGMHLIIATQRPTVNIITGLIKANIPSRIALSVMSQMDSRTILDTGGAEKLLGHGDMLYLPNGMPKPVRIQGCFCSTKEIEQVVNFIKAQGTAQYSEDIMSDIEKAIPSGGSNQSDDDTYLDSDEDIIEKAITIAVEAGQVSTSNLQRKLKLGYARAARIVDQLEEMGIVGPADGAKPRKVLMSQQAYLERRNNLSK